MCVFVHSCPNLWCGIVCTLTCLICTYAVASIHVFKNVPLYTLVSILKRNACILRVAGVQKLNTFLYCVWMHVLLRSSFTLHLMHRPSLQTSRKHCYCLWSSVLISFVTQMHILSKHLFQRKCISKLVFVPRDIVSYGKRLKYRSQNWFF